MLKSIEVVRRLMTAVTAAVTQWFYDRADFAIIGPSPFETLEDRRLMSASYGVSFSNGTLNLVGSSSGSNMTVQFASDHSKVTANVDSKSLLTIPLSSLSTINFTGGNGNDTIYVDSSIKVTANIIAGDGNDSIRTSGGFSTVNGGNGNKWIRCQGTGTSVKLGDGNNTVLGSQGNDTIVAGNGNNSLDGGNGSDVITAGNGNNSVLGQSGNDNASLGNGNNYISAGNDDDTITVGSGKNTVDPGSGSNTIKIGGTNTTIVSNPGKNTVLNSSGNVVTNPTSGGSTTGTSPSGSAAWQSYYGVASTGGRPQAILQILAPNYVVGSAIAVRGLNSVLAAGKQIDALYQWNFGDAAGKFNTLTGFNAGHVYTTPGTYNVSLTVSNRNGLSSSVSTNVVIASDGRSSVYVNAATGSDANNGSDTSHPIRSIARLAGLLRNNENIFFARGQTFDLSAGIVLNYSNMVIGTYGSGSSPVINYTAPAPKAFIFNTIGSKSVTIQDLTFTTLNDTNPGVADQPMAIMPGGLDTAILRNTFRHVQYAINASGNPTGLYVESNSAPLGDGLQAYFLWNQGTDASVIANYVAGSVHEHNLRAKYADEMLIYGNTFTNLDGKGSIEIQWASHAWIEHNTTTGGDIRVGPLGLWGEDPTSATNDCVIAGNTINNSFIHVTPGAHEISIRNNVIKRDSAYLIDVTGTDSAGRLSSDIRILNNTGISNGTAGSFLVVWNHVNGITLMNNLLVQPNLSGGQYAAAPVYVYENNLNSFTSITNNVWQQPKSIIRWAQGGINFVGTSYDAVGYQTASEWNSLAQVGTDVFGSTAISSNFAPNAGSIADREGAYEAGVFYDLNGKTRSTSGSWTAGAVQL